MIRLLKTPTLLLGSLLLVCGGCFNLEPRANPTQFYVLGGATDLPEREADGGLAVGLRDLNLAAYLQTPLIVVRQGTHEVRFAEFHRWGEDLARGINRAVAGYLATGPVVGRTDIVPWPRYVAYDYVVQLRVLRFEGVQEGPLNPDAAFAPEGAAHLLASWEILDPADDAVLARGTTDLLEEGWTTSDYGELVALLDASLQVLAGDLLAALVELES